MPTTIVQGLPASMTAAEVHEFNKPYLIHQIPPPQALEEYDILIRVAAASFCHTDLMVLAGVMGSKPTKCSGGHEPTGTIHAMGSSAATSGFKVGDRIAALGFRGPCGECADCNGPVWGQIYCKRFKGFVGLSAPGAFQEYTVVDARYSVVLPSSLSFVAAAPLTCAGATAWRAIKTVEIEKGQWVGIVGSGGGLGHLGVQFAVAQGYKVLGIDARDEGLALSKKAGVHAVIDARIGLRQVLKEVAKITGGTMVQAAVVFSDHETAAETACAICQDHSTVVQVAQPEKVSVDFKQFIFRDIRLRGSLLANRDEFQELIDHVAHKGLQVEIKVFDGLSSLPKLVEEVRQGKYAGKMVVAVDPEGVRDDLARSSRIRSVLA